MSQKLSRSAASAVTRGRRDVFIEAFEPRCLLSAVYPTVYEQYMVQLYNWARANPTAAATKYGVDLNEGPPAQTITADAKQPLAINPYLTDAARSFAGYLMSTGQFDHFAGGTTPGGRMSASGYVFNNPYGAGENAGLTSYFGGSDYTSTVDYHFENFYDDPTISGRWHRINMMDPDYKEIGSGISVGTWQGASALISVQDFAYSGTGSFLTGVAYTDSNQDNFYTPGEQMSGVTVTAIRNSDGAVFTTTTWDSGGYTLALPDGTYTVWAGGGTLGGYVRDDNVTVGPVNVELDFRPDYVGNDPGPNTFARLSGNQLIVQGTSASDLIIVSTSDKVYVNVNGVFASFDPTLVQQLVVYGNDGDDAIYIQNGPYQVSVYGGAGNDTISGTGGNDMLDGGDGDDRIYGGDGDDLLVGGAGNDRLYGGNGNDTLLGQDGNDCLFGQNGNDWLDGGAGADNMSGGAGFDTVDYSSRTANLTISLGDRYQAPNDGEAGENDNVLNDIEEVIGGSGNDLIIASTSAINELLIGGGGNDTLIAGGGLDTLLGGDGDDLLISANTSSDFLDGGNGNDTAQCDASDLVVNCENLMVLSATRASTGRLPYRPPTAS